MSSCHILVSYTLLLCWSPFCSQTIPNPFKAWTPLDPWSRTVVSTTLTDRGVVLLTDSLSQIMPARPGLLWITTLDLLYVCIHAVGVYSVSGTDDFRSALVHCLTPIGSQFINTSLLTKLRRLAENVANHPTIRVSQLLASKTSASTEASKCRGPHWVRSPWFKQYMNRNWHEVVTNPFPLLWAQTHAFKFPAVLCLTGLTECVEQTVSASEKCCSGCTCKSRCTWTVSAVSSVRQRCSRSVKPESQSRGWS